MLFKQVQEVAHEIIALLPAAREENIRFAGYNRELFGAEVIICRQFANVSETKALLADLRLAVAQFEI